VQRRFWEHQIRDEADFVRHVDYIHWNPVKHGYVRRAAEWPYSTFHRYVRSGVYAEDWGGIPDSAGDFGE
jgi:putative transposase